MTIYDIKRIHEQKTNGSYFSHSNMKFFNQTLRQFSVHKVSDTVYHISCPSYWCGKLMGISKAEFNTITGELTTL